MLHRHAPRVDLERLEKPADAYRLRHLVQLAVELNGHRGERTAVLIASSRQGHHHEFIQYATGARTRPRTVSCLFALDGFLQLEHHQFTLTQPTSSQYNIQFC